MATDAGEQIQRVFAAEDFLENLTGDEMLLDCRVVLHPDHVLEEKLVAGEVGWVNQSLILVPQTESSAAPRSIRGCCCCCRNARDG